MEAQQPQPFDRAAFKAALLAKVTAITPKTLEEADEFKSSGKAGEIKSAVTTQVAEGKDQAQGPIEQTARETPDPSGFQPKPVTPLAANDPGPPAPDLGAAAAAPKPKTPAAVEVPVTAASQSLDRKMADAEVTEEQLESSNEPEFQAAVGAKRQAQTHAREAPAGYRAAEQGTLATAQTQADSTATAQTQAMHGVRAGLLAQVTGQQQASRSADELKRAEVARRIEAIYQDAKQKVDARLAKLDQEVNGLFDRGAAAAGQAFEEHVASRMAAYKARRYGDWGGSLLWAKDKLFGMPAEVNVFYVEGRELYVQKMDGVIDQIATAVEIGLTEAKDLISEGRKQVQEYVTGLPLDLQKVGHEAADSIKSKFDSLEQSVDDKQSQLIDSLAQKYVDNLQKIDARVEEMKAANRGFVDAALDALGGVLKTILQLKDMLLGVLAKAAAVVGKILEDPIGFLGNLIEGVKLGLSNFIGNLGAHLKQGLLAWLFGALAEAGIQVPESFDLKGILSLILQVLGLTYANIRARAVAIVGEPVVSALEKTAEVFKVIITEGPAGLWRFIQDKLTELKETVMEGIKSFIMERVIIAGITWLIGLLNPAAAFVKACKAIYDVVMFFVTRGSQIIALVNAILDSMAAIASGALASAAAAVENALAKGIPVVIGFLASLLGLGGISDKIREILQKIRAPIDKAIDWVIHLAVKAVKAVGGLFGKKKEEPPAAETGDPEHDAKVAAGLAAIDQEEQAHLSQGKISYEEAQSVAASVEKKHPIFKSIIVSDGGERWNYEYVASPGKVKAGEKKAEGTDKALETLIQRFGNRLQSKGGALEEMLRRASQNTNPVHRRAAAMELRTLIRYLEHGAPDGRKIAKLEVIPSGGTRTPDFVVHFPDGTLQRIEVTARTAAPGGRLPTGPDTGKARQELAAATVARSDISEGAVATAIKDKAKGSQLLEPLAGVPAGGAIIVHVMGFGFNAQKAASAMEKAERSGKLGPHVERVEISFMEGGAGQKIIQVTHAFRRSANGTYVPIR